MDKNGSTLLHKAVGAHRNNVKSATKMTGLLKEQVIVFDINNDKNASVFRT